MLRHCKNSRENVTTRNVDLPNFLGPKPLWFGSLHQVCTPWLRHLCEQMEWQHQGLHWSSSCNHRHGRWKTTCCKYKLIEMFERYFKTLTSLSECNDSSIRNSLVQCWCFQRHFFKTKVIGPKCSHFQNLYVRMTEHAHTVFDSRTVFNIVSRMHAEDCRWLRLLKRVLLVQQLYMRYQYSRTPTNLNNLHKMYITVTGQGCKTSCQDFTWSIFKRYSWSYHYNVKRRYHDNVIVCCLPTTSNQISRC